MWIEILCIEYILWRILTTKSMFDVTIILKRWTVKDVPTNNYELSNIQAMFWNRGSAPNLSGHPIGHDESWGGAEVEYCFQIFQT